MGFPHVDRAPPQEWKAISGLETVVVWSRPHMFPSLFERLSWSAVLLDHLQPRSFSKEAREKNVPRMEIHSEIVWLVLVDATRLRSLNHMLWEGLSYRLCVDIATNGHIHIN